MGDRLFEGDWNYALNTIYCLNELEDLGVFQRKTLELIRLSIPFCQGIFYTYKRDDAGVYSLRGDPVVVGMKALYLYEFDKKYSRDVFFTKVSLSTHDKVIRDTDMMPDELRMNTEWYKEIYAKQGIHYALRSHLTYDGVILGSVDFFRAKEEVNFSDKEMDLLGILSPHITLKLMQLLRAEGAGSGRSGLEHRLSSSCGLTARECEVVGMLLTSKPDKVIAEELCISPSTLKKHIHNVYRKIGVKSRHQLYSAVDKMMGTLG